VRNTGGIQSLSAAKRKDERIGDKADHSNRTRSSTFGEKGMNSRFNFCEERKR
jgi:hypothetical protein